MPDDRHPAYQAVTLPRNSEIRSASSTRPSSAGSATVNRARTVVVPPTSAAGVSVSGEFGQDRCRLHAALTSAIGVGCGLLADRDADESAVAECLGEGGYSGLGVLLVSDEYFVVPVGDRRGDQPQAV